jgi:hypothetical protein
MIPVLCLGLVAAKGGKKNKKEEAPPPAPAPAAAEPAPEPEPEPAPVPEEPPAPRVVKNVDPALGVTVTWADGTTKAGKLQGIERSASFSGGDEWVEEARKLTIAVVVGSSEKSVAWKDVKSVTVAPGKLPDDVDCTYSSDFSPWMYFCSLRTTTTVVMKDGTKGTASEPYVWRLTFDDASTTDLQLYKHTELQRSEIKLVALF